MVAIDLMQRGWRMRLHSYLLLPFVFAGCLNPVVPLPDGGVPLRWEREPASRGLQRYHDDRYGVTCWALVDYGHISCLPDSELKVR